MIEFLVTQFSHSLFLQNEFVYKITIMIGKSKKIESLLGIILGTIDSYLQLNSTVKPVFSDHIKRELFLAFQTDVCLLLYESSLYYSYPAISNYLSENPKYVWIYMVA